MRQFLASLLLLLALPLLGGERAVRGAESLLGPNTLAPLSDWRPYGGPTSIASDGDEILVVFVARYSLYAQRLDRNGVAVTALPQLLVRRLSQGSTVNVFAVYAGGHYVVFYTQYDERGSLRAMRLTRELQIVSEHVVPASTASLTDVAVAGDEIIIASGRDVMRLRHDLSVIERLTNFDATAIVPAPHGVLILTNVKPAVSARMLDGSSSVRIDYVSTPTTAQGVWTGSHFVVVWASYGWIYMVTLDKDLRASQVVTLEKSGCGECGVQLAALSADEALVTWTPAGGSTRAARVRNGLVVDQSPWLIGDQAKIFETSSGRFLTVDRKLKVRMFDVPPATAPAQLPVLATVQTAAEETLVDVAYSATEVAVARHRPNGTNVVSILDREGRPLREIAIRDGGFVSLASDGQDFYALITSYPYAGFFQKVATGAPVAQLPNGIIDELEWGGTGFAILQSGYTDYTGQTQYRTRVLWVTREGKLELPPCPVWELPSTERATLTRAGDDIHIIVGTSATSIRRDCEFMPLDKLDPHWRVRASFHDGVWARVTSYDYGLAFSLASSPAAPAERHRVAARQYTFYERFDVAPLGDGGWLVVYKDGDLRSAIFDAAGHLIGTSTLAEDQSGPVFLVPISTDRVLAITQRTVWDAPYLGVSRVFATVITTETASRRRTARP